MLPRSPFLLLIVILSLNVLITSQRLMNNNYHDDYPWMECTTFEATKKNCPRGESCLKLKKFRNYAWYHNWAMKCQSREEFLAAVEYIYGL